MNSSIRIFLVTAVVIASVGYLILTGVHKTGMHYMTVTELAELNRPPKAGGFRLDGMVATGSIAYDQRAPRLAFSMTDGKQVIGVVYDGLMPDAFAEGREVVVEGTFDHHRKTLHASKLVTKCPSKYESEGLGEDRT